MASITSAVDDTCSGAPFSQAPTPRSAVNSSCRFGIEDGADHRLAVDLEGQRRAENRHAMREVGRAVERVEDPAMGVATRPAVAELLGEDVVFGEALGEQRPAHVLDLDVDLGDQVDGPLLVDADAGPETRPLDRPGAGDDLDGRRQVAGIGRRHEAVASAAASRLTMRTSMPPSGRRRNATSSMNERIRKMPRPLDFSRFSGASGSATCSGSNPSP